MKPRLLFPAFLCVHLTCGLRTSNYGSSGVFDIFVQGNDIFNTTTIVEDTDKDEDVPPPHDETAKMARYVCHKSDWAAMATIAARDPVRGFPFANVFSVSDGSVGESTGVPYMYTTPMEMSVQDLQSNPEASLTMSLAQSNYCSKQHYDPEDPRCAHIILTGTVVTVLKGSAEAEFAERALFSRHPVMPSWPKDHAWFFAKLNISNILLLDFFGGAVNIPLEDYFDANVN